MKIEDLNMTEEELDELENLLKTRKAKATYEKNIKAINEHKKYIGKCYKEDKKYIRVLSSKSSNASRFECMCFEFPITYDEKHFYTKIFNPINAFSTIDFQGIYIEDYPLLCNSWGTSHGLKIVDSLTEITEEEYFSKMDEYIKNLQIMIKNGDFDTSKNNSNIFE